MLRPLPLLAALPLLLVAAPAAAGEIPVKNTTELSAAIAAAKAGDVIVLAAGTYRSTGFSCTASGTSASPIVVKSAAPLAAQIELDGLEGFKVSGAHWQFEGLDVKGVCADDNKCEHAFHVVGKAVGFVLRDNRIVDFNAQLKANAAKDSAGTWQMPHDGLLEGNEVFDTRARNTSNPVTKFNIDTGDRWVVRGNYIHDYEKGAGDGVSYGAFMKSGGKDGIFEKNLVVCSTGTTTGTRIGLSFGGGGTAPQYCYPGFDASVPCAVEHDGGTMRNNVIASCTDVAIYLNRAKSTRILHNTLVRTAGVDFRFATTTGEAHGNFMAGKIRMRDGGTFTGSDNLVEVTDGVFTAMYVNPSKGDLRLKGAIAAIEGKAATTTVTDDYCNRARGAAPNDYGALESSLGDCPTLFGTTPAPGGDAGTAGDGGTTTPPGGDAGSASDSGGSSGTDSGAPADDGANPAADTDDSTGCGFPASRRTNGAFVALALGVAVLLRRRVSLTSAGGRA